MTRPVSSRRCPTLAVAAVLVLAAVGPLGAAIRAEPVPITADSRPFFAAATDLAAHGFVEEEWFLRGTGSVYEYDLAGEVRVRTPDVPYATRMLVRRPTSPGRFNGVVVVELLNPTALHDIDFEWQYNRELLLEEGYAWVGVTMKGVAVDDLVDWNPERYAGLFMPDDGLAYPLTADVGLLLRDGARSDNPLAGFDVRTVIATGYSQTSDYLTTFSNEFHETTRTPDGSHAYDGYLLGGGNGAARRINSTDPILYIDDRRLNRVNAPLIRVQSETEVAIFFFSSIGVRQPDSEVFRLYEIAGGSHADEEGLRRTGEVISRDNGGPILPPCEEPLSPLDIGPAHRAALANLVRWIEDGVEPPPGVLLTLDDDGNVVRDADGNAVGGIRLPTIDVPLGRFEPGNIGILPCPVAGAYYAFDEDTIDARFRSHGAYVSAVAHSAESALSAGHVTESDAERYIVQAARSDVGR